VGSEMCIRDRVKVSNLDCGRLKKGFGSSAQLL